MTRYMVQITSERKREEALRVVRAAPQFSRVEIKAQKRTLPQNSRLWALLTDIALQTDWHGVKLSPDDWKLLMLSGLKAEMRIVPNLDGSGFVNLGTRSSDLSVEEMSDLIELIHAFAAKRGIQFHWEDA
jgi:hypothetical protein